MKVVLKYGHKYFGPSAQTLSISKPWSAGLGIGFEGKTTVYQSDVWLADNIIEID